MNHHRGGLNGDIPVIRRHPWTQETVDALNERQKSGTVHPYTCGGNRTDAAHLDGEGVLVATVNGWMCPYCDYRQDWFHEDQHELFRSRDAAAGGRHLLEKQVKASDIPSVFASCPAPLARICTGESKCKQVDQLTNSAPFVMISLGGSQWPT